jgi:ABC-type antimicrobial peptide transport system permease subunit
VTPFADAYVGPATDGPPMVIMLAAVLLLLVVCANVASMLLGHAAGRGREIAVRAVLGASRARIVRQLLVESAMLSAVAGSAGLVLALVAIRFFAAETADLNLPYWIRFDFDLGVFAFWPRRGSSRAAAPTARSRTAIAAPPAASGPGDGSAPC